MRFSLPIQLLFVLALAVIFGSMLSVNTINLFFTFSSLFKEFLSFVLPFLVFFFVFSGITSFKKNAPIIVLILLGVIFISNFCTAMLSYLIMKLFFPFISQCNTTASLVQDDVIRPLFSFTLPKLIRSEHALILALISGFITTIIQPSSLEGIMSKIKDWMGLFIQYTIITFLPLYVFGFLLKIQYEGTMFFLVREYSGTFFLIVCAQIVYLLWMFLLAHGFDVQAAFRAIANALPSYLTAFSTMSSTATIPVAIKNAEKNIENPTLALMAMPIMANVHLLGDCIGTPILAMVTMLLFKGCLPLLGEYFTFVLYFCTSMFAVSGIPGGGILVMIPVLVSHFGFTPEMVSIITTLYLLLDPFGTATNVMGDGALVIIMDKLLKKLGLV